MVTETVYLEQQEQARRQKEAKEAEARAAGAQVTQPKPPAQQTPSGFNDQKPSGEPVQNPMEAMVQQNPLAAFFVMLFAMLFGGKDLFGKSGVADLQNAFKGYTDQDAADDNADFSPGRRIEKLHTSGTTRIAPMDMSGIPSGERQKSVIAAMPYAAQSAGVSPDLLKGLWGVESRFGSALQSPTGCKGDFQFTRGTFRSVINENNEQIASSIEKDLGNKGLADKVRGMKGQSSSAIESYRNDPTIATYAAAFYAKEVAQAVKVDPKQENSFGAIYAGYNVGPGNALKLKRLEAQGSDASAKAILGYVADVNPMFYKNGANAAEALANYQNSIRTRASDFDRKFGPNPTVSASAPSAAADTALASNGGPVTLALPLNSVVTSDMGPRDTKIKGASTNHGGIDMRAAVGTPLTAQGPAQVAYAGPSGGYGQAVILNHGQGVFTLYGHVEPNMPVKTGQMLQKGQQFAVTGDEGVGAPHLHYEILLQGRNGRAYRVDPEQAVGKNLSDPAVRQQLIAQAADKMGINPNQLASRAFDSRVDDDHKHAPVLVAQAQSQPNASKSAERDPAPSPPRTTTSVARAELGNWLAEKLPGIAPIFKGNADPATATAEPAKADVKADVAVAKAEPDANKPAAPVTVAKVEDDQKPKVAAPAPAPA